MADYNNNEPQHQAKNYSFDVQKLYIEMLLADAESFARAQNIFNPNSFDRKLQPIAKFVKDYMDEYKVMPEDRFKEKDVWLIIITTNNTRLRTIRLMYRNCI